ncbi:MAG: hypothetical protein EOP50_06035 [Sphingobacteriales bacterium]|nr:MAG: hypothetical protein EOP50_06035 [Sphingobacteriales bacterium]
MPSLPLLPPHAAALLVLIATPPFGATIARPLRPSLDRGAASVTASASPPLSDARRRGLVNTMSSIDSRRADATSSPPVDNARPSRCCGGPAVAPAAPDTLSRRAGSEPGRAVLPAFSRNSSARPVTSPCSCSTRFFRAASRNSEATTSPRSTCTLDCSAARRRYSLRSSVASAGAAAAPLLPVRELVAQFTVTPPGVSSVEPLPVSAPPGPAVPGVKAGLKIMERNTNRLLDIANQLLDFRETEVKGFALNFQESDVAALLLDLHTSFRPLAQQSRLALSLDMPFDHFPAMVDSDSLQKIISNLYSNAIKYARSRVEVRFSVLTQTKQLRIEFRNDGYLVPHELRDKIFEPFFRISETSNQKGTGIGLAISKTLAELNKGRLLMERPVGDMNVFVLELNTENAGTGQQNVNIPVSMPVNEEKQSIREGFNYREYELSKPATR